MTPNELEIRNYIDYVRFSIRSMKRLAAYFNIPYDKMILRLEELELRDYFRKKPKNKGRQLKKRFKYKRLSYSAIKR